MLLPEGALVDGVAELASRIRAFFPLLVGSRGGRALVRRAGPLCAGTLVSRTVTGLLHRRLELGNFLLGL